ncbi:hypothetical protein ABIB45_000606 [Arthrobacter sp. UYCo732]
MTNYVRDLTFCKSACNKLGTVPEFLPLHGALLLAIRTRFALKSPKSWAYSPFGSTSGAARNVFPLIVT